MLQSDPVKFMPNSVMFTPLVFPTKATSQYATIASQLIVLQGLLPAYSHSAFTGSEDNTD